MKFPPLLALALACAAPVKAPPSPEPLNIPMLIDWCKKDGNKDWRVSDIGGVTLFACEVPKPDTICVDTSSLRRPPPRRLARRTR